MCRFYLVIYRRVVFYVFHFYLIINVLYSCIIFTVTKIRTDTVETAYV